ncbi:hypothetical protein HAX54_001467 [Datura stramonium]|uniref:Uncharacterized protein n=1 Tax=Datura stramonium TaxID=4076 RepID=A0ABS8T2E3_DATST|nr:hypothetical protein [Datura stramonium]
MTWERNKIIKRNIERSNLIYWQSGLRHHYGKREGTGSPHRQRQIVKENCFMCSPQPWKKRPEFQLRGSKRSTWFAGSGYYLRVYLLRCCRITCAQTAGSQMTKCAVEHQNTFTQRNQFSVIVLAASYLDRNSNKKQSWSMGVTFSPLR